MSIDIGKLYIVSTPIGNLDDITIRAIDTLKTVDIVAAEDTRRTRELLNHFNINTKVISFFEYSNDNKIDYIIDELKKGKNIALVSDAGTPIISDPGSRLIKALVDNDIDFTAIPGACAAINAVVLSGLKAKAFTFIGFLPDDNKKRNDILDYLSDKKEALIFYVSSHDLLSNLKTFIKVFSGERQASLSREMTKKFEETVRGKLDFIYDYYKDKKILGEFVLVIEGLSDEEYNLKETNKWLNVDINEHYTFYINQGLTEKEAMKKVANDRGVGKSEIYKILKVQ